MTRMQPVNLAAIMRPYAGNWVAIKHGRVVEAAETPYMLSMRLRDREIHDATIIRSPRLGEAELVGLG